MGRLLGVHQEDYRQQAPQTEKDFGVGTLSLRMTVSCAAAKTLIKRTRHNPPFAQAYRCLTIRRSCRGSFAGRGETLPSERKPSQGTRSVRQQASRLAMH